MKITIPTDQELGQQIEFIARAAAAVIALVYTAGFAFGYSIHWLSSNFTKLHRFMLHDSTPQKSDPIFDSSFRDSRCDLRSQASKSPAKGFK